MCWKVSFLASHTSKRSTCGCRRVSCSRLRRSSNSPSSTFGRGVTIGDRRQPPPGPPCAGGRASLPSPPCSDAESRCQCRRPSKPAHPASSSSSSRWLMGWNHRSPTTPRNSSRRNTRYLYVDNARIFDVPPRTLSFERVVPGSRGMRSVITRPIICIAIVVVKDFAGESLLESRYLGAADVFIQEQMCEGGANDLFLGFIRMYIHNGAEKAAIGHLHLSSNIIIYWRQKVGDVVRLGR